jgi:hypothetical protein
MPGLEFRVNSWLASDLVDPKENETLSSLTIAAGDVPLTEVNDVFAHTVRDSIHVPMYLAVRWLLLNWWRLRWEPRPAVPGFDWRKAHSMAAISSDYAWPSVTFDSDGDFIHVQARAEQVADVAAVRYLRNIDVRVPARQFEKAVDDLVDVLEVRLASRLPDERELREVREELREERTDPTLAHECKLQALAGLHPGTADPQWLISAIQLAREAGPSSGDEVIAASTTMPDRLAGARRTLAAMRGSPWVVKLDPSVDVPLAVDDELPWQRGRRLAAAFRARLGVRQGPLATGVLEDLLETRLAAGIASTTGATGTGRRALAGGFREDVDRGRTSLLPTSSRRTNQRFYVARLIGAAIVADPADRVLPVSDVQTALQKFERSFAQELLCPWVELDALTDDRGTDEAGVQEAADYFEVSEYLVISALVNNGKISRNRLPVDLM